MSIKIKAYSRDVTTVVTVVREPDGTASRCLQDKIMLLRQRQATAHHARVALIGLTV